MGGRTFFNTFLLQIAIVGGKACPPESFSCHQSTTISTKVLLGEANQLNFQTIVFLRFVLIDPVTVNCIGLHRSLSCVQFEHIKQLRANPLC